MTGDIHDIVNRVVSEAQQDRRRKMIEDFIDSIVNADSYREVMVNALLYNRACGIPDAAVRDEIKAWVSGNSSEIAYKWREMLRILLKQELLGEQ